MGGLLEASPVQPPERPELAAELRVPRGPPDVRTVVLPRPGTGGVLGRGGRSVRYYVRHVPSPAGSPISSRLLARRTSSW
jgi:hypothetical protein